MPDQKKQNSQTTPQDVAALKEAFKLFDSDNDGVISKEELAAVMKSMGLATTSTEVEDMINEVDLDQTGTVDLEEFIKMMTAETKPVHIEQELRNAFKMFDKDNSGTLSKQEIAHVLEVFGQKPTEEEIEIMFQEVDKDGNGTIDYEEFVRFYMET